MRGQKLVVPDKVRCIAVVWVRDTYRHTGRGAGGFELHYNRQRCSRRGYFNPLFRSLVCWQHVKHTGWVAYD